MSVYGTMSGNFNGTVVLDLPKARFDFSTGLVRGSGGFAVAVHRHHSRFNDETSSTYKRWKVLLGILRLFVKQMMLSCEKMAHINGNCNKMLQFQHEVPALSGYKITAILGILIYNRFY